MRAYNLLNKIKLHKRGQKEEDDFLARKEKVYCNYCNHWIASWWLYNDEVYYFVNIFSDDSYGYLYILIIKHTFRNWEVAIETNISFIIMMIFWGGRVRPFHVIMTNTIKTFYWLGDASRIMIYLSTLKLDIWLLIFFFWFWAPQRPYTS